MVARAHDGSRDGQAGRLDHLVGFVVELASGRLDTRLEPSEASDEIDAMIVGLNMLAEELQGLTEELEQRVDQRTRQLAAAHGELERLALHDPLTGLANRTLLAARIAEAMVATERGGLPPAVLVLDLDGFKAVNDSFGHLAGDELLRVIAGRLQRMVRDGDTVARLGGDEFAVLVTGATTDQVLEIAARVQGALADAVEAGGQTCWVSASIGVRFGTRGEVGETFLRDADTAMYAAKGRARGSVSVFEPSMHQAARTRLQLADELRAALAADELFVLYQPIVDLGSGRVVGVEALVRWNHPRRGVLTPDAFVPVAEDTGLVASLDRWVLESAVAQVARWRSGVLGDAPFTVHVNLSPVDLRAPRFAEGVLGALARHRVSPSDLTVEITENHLLGEDVPTLQTMEALRSAGVGVAIDDFGTGTSSLGYCRRSFVDTIKIDRSLVSGLDVSPSQHRVLAAILTVIEAFALEAVAEGVETEGEAAGLIALGCARGQGYLFGDGRSADQIADLLGTPVA